MRRNFVVFCDARTGSYNLVSRLGSCPDIVCHGEIFKKNRIEVAAFHRRRLSIKSTGSATGGPWRSSASSGPSTRAGTSASSCSPPISGWAPGALDYVLAPDTLRILLLRTPLEIYASRLRVQRTGVYTVQTGEARRLRRTSRCTSPRRASRPSRISTTGMSTCAACWPRSPAASCSTTSRPATRRRWTRCSASSARRRASPRPRASTASSTTDRSRTPSPTGTSSSRRCRG